MGFVGIGFAVFIPPRDIKNPMTTLTSGASADGFQLAPVSAAVDTPELIAAGAVAAWCVAAAAGGNI
jgi:hypothetical protein